MVGRYTLRLKITRRRSATVHTGWATDIETKGVLPVPTEVNEGARTVGIPEAGK